jgi:hypothetical protein
VANEDHAVGPVDVHITASDKETSYRTAEIHHVDGEGKITERWAFAEVSHATVDIFAVLG